MGFVGGARHALREAVEHSVRALRLAAGGAQLQRAHRVGGRHVAQPGAVNAQAEVVERRAEDVRDDGVHARGEPLHLEAELPQQPAEAAVQLVAEAAAVLAHDLVHHARLIQHDGPARRARVHVCGHVPCSHARKEGTARTTDG